MDGISESPSPSPIPGGSPAPRRRQVAFYPNMNSSNKPQKPFSRSAAKRASVMALGSIEHLQHYFTKTGIAAESDPLNKPHSGMVPAIGSLATLPKRPQGNSHLDVELPPSPIVPEIVQPAFSPFVRTYEVDPENLRPGAIEDLAAVEIMWFLQNHHPDRSSLLNVQNEGSNKSAKQTTGSENVDILELLKATTHAIRSVRNYLLTLPDDSATPMQHAFRAQALPSTPLPKRYVSQPNSSTNPLSRIRSAALDVLIVLRALEEASRLPLTDDAYDAQSDHGEQASVAGSHHSGSGSGTGSGSSALSRGPSPDFLDVDMDTSVSFVRVSGGARSVPVWDDGSFDMNQASEEDDREKWDERLVLGGGWLYRQDIKREELEKERQVVKRYLDAVDEILFDGTQEGVRGWERERVRFEKERRRARRVSSVEFEGSPERNRLSRRISSMDLFEAVKGMALTVEPEDAGDFFLETDGADADDDGLPNWAKRSEFQDDPLGRVHALLLSLLPPTLQPLLPPQPITRSALLQALSSGQLLCVAYNAGVRRSRKPWGFVNKDAIHDIALLESSSFSQTGEDAKDKGKSSWTFRRTDNLRLWAAALKLRYMLPILTTNPSKSSSKTAPKSRSASSPASKASSKLFSSSSHLTPMPTPTPSISSQIFPAIAIGNGHDVSNNEGTNGSAGANESSSNGTVSTSILFDAPAVARLYPGWEDMLFSVVMKWVQAVVEEKRSER